MSGRLRLVLNIGLVVLGVAYCAGAKSLLGLPIIVIGGIRIVRFLLAYAKEDDVDHETHGRD